MITIQTDGPRNFAAPVPVRFLNLPDPVTGVKLPPGAKTALWSFDHDKGYWEIVGPATVTEDGEFVETDPGVGVLQPGWHGVQPGSQTLPPCPPRKEAKQPAAPDLMIEAPEAVLFYHDNAFIELIFANELPAVLSLNSLLCGYTDYQPVHVSLEWEGETEQFLDVGAPNQEFELYPGGPPIHWIIRARPLLGDVWSIKHDRLYAARLTLKISDPRTHAVLRESRHYFYRFLDAADDNHGDGVVAFPDTMPGVTRARPIQGPANSSFAPKLVVSGHPAFSVADSPNAQFLFRPTRAQGTVTAQVEVRSPEDKPAGTLWLTALTKFQKVFVDTDAFERELDFLATHNPNRDLTPAKIALINTPEKRAGIVQGSVDDAVARLAAATDGVTFVATPDADAILFNNFQTPPDKPLAVFGDSHLVDANSNGGFLELLKHCPQYSATEQNYRLSRVLNQSPAGQIDIYLKNYLGSTPVASPEDIIRTLGKTIAHEIGHAVGLTHTTGINEKSKPVHVGADVGTARKDIMAQGEDTDGVRRFSLSIPPLRVALGDEWDEDTGQRAVDYYRQFQLAGGDFDAEPPQRDPNALTAPQFDGPVAWLVAGPERRFVNSPLDFGEVEVDGPAGAVITRSMELLNIGDRPLNLAAVTLDAPADSWALTPVAPGTQVPVGGALPLSISFDPAIVGPAEARLLIQSDALAGEYRLKLVGRGTSSGPALWVDLPNNNLGGAIPGGLPQSRPRLFTLRNAGGLPLQITDLHLESAEQPLPFRIVNLTTPPTPAQPLVLSPGAELAFDVEFRPGRQGLIRGEIVLAANDPRRPSLRLPLIGTGLPEAPGRADYGYDFVQVTFPLSTNAPIRRRSSQDGFWSVIVPPDSPIEVRMFDPATGQLAWFGGRSANAGMPTPVAPPYFRASTAPDSDGDGLPDDIEAVIGSNPAETDTDDDGLSDLEEVLSGLDPLASRPAQGGPLAVARTEGPARDLALAGDWLVTAEDTGGLGTWRPMANGTLTRLGRIATPGPAQRLSVWDRWAAVACGGSGLAVLDLAIPDRPQLAHVVPLKAGSRNAVLAIAGHALAAPAGEAKLLAVDLLTGQVRSEVELPEFRLLDLVSLGGFVYALTSDSIEIFSFEFGELRHLRRAEVSSWPPPLRLAPITAGLLVTRSFGLDRFDLTAPDTLALQNTYENWNLTWQMAVPFADDSFLVLAEGPTAGDQPNVMGRGVNIFTVGPDGSPLFQTRIPTPQAPTAAVTRNGRAFLALGEGGLMVADFRTVEPPSAPLSVDLIGGDRAAQGLVEGRAVALQVRVDKVSTLRQVELYLDGLRVAADADHPYEFTVTAPRWQPDRSSITVGVRAVARNGDSGWSSSLVIPILRDLLAPQVTARPSLSGRTFGATSLRSVSVRFDEPLDPASLAPDSFQLIGLGPDELADTADDQVWAAAPGYSPGTLWLTLTVSTALPAGRYQVRLNRAIADTAGNHLAQGEIWPCTVFHVDAASQPAFVIRGNIDQVGVTDSYSFTPAAGQRLFFKLPEFSLWWKTAPKVVWSLLGPNASVIASGTLGVQTLGAVTFNQPGIYTFVIGGPDDRDTGEFVIEATPVPPPERFALEIGAEVRADQPAVGAGRVEARGSHDLYTFTAPAGSSVNLELLGYDEGLTFVSWKLTDEGGTVLLDRYLSGGSPGRITLERGGHYTLDVGSDREPGTGHYHFRLLP
ncbi:MAG: hypothetical protein IPM17_09985 [Verrucomicrobia bacterium]|nr:hypothetical protein [Verrucomicrobiota bacterium]